ncbi:MAG: FliM/FliN family flagellar motor switch protein [Bacillota bacterium]
MADGGPLSQEDIDALLAQMGNKAGDPGKPVAKGPAKKRPAGGEEPREPMASTKRREPAARPGECPVDPRGQGGNGRREDLLPRLLDLPVTLTVTMADTMLPVGEVLGFLPGRVVEMDRGIRAPAEVFVDGHLLAKGEIVVVGDRYGIHIKEVVSPRQRLQGLAR